ncbi:5974_t:CDS:2, partial [Dentiscutata heterogama]
MNLQAILEESNKNSFLAFLDHESVASSDYQLANVIKRGRSQSTSKYHLRTAYGIFNTDDDDSTILTDEGFTELIAEAFPFYKLSSEKMVKSILLESYNY